MKLDTEFFCKSAAVVAVCWPIFVCAGAIAYLVGKDYMDEMKKKSKAKTR